MNRRGFLKRSAGLAAVGGMATMAGCGAAAPEDMLVTANLSVEAEGGNAFAEVTGKVWVTTEEGMLSPPEKVELRVTLLDGETTVASTTKVMPIDQSSEDGTDYSVSFSLNESKATRSLSADTVVTAVWHDGQKTTRAVSASGED